MKTGIKIVLAVVMIASVMSLGIIGCAKEEAPMPAVPAKVFSWKLQSAWPPPEVLMGHWGGYGQYCEIARRVKERTNGGLDIKVYVPNALFKVLEAPEAVKKGAIEVLGSSGPYHGGILPEAKLEWGLPFALKTRQQVNKLRFETDFYEIYRKALIEKHNVYLAYIADVSAYVYLTTFPIHSLADLKGKKIRAVGGIAGIVKAHGAVPVALAGAEQYTALQRGTVDGTIYPAYAGITYKMFEVTKYVLWPPVYRSPTIQILVNMEAWNSLPKEYQDILLEEAEKMSKYTYEVSSDALVEIAQEEGKKQFGIESIWLSDAEFAKFGEACMPLWDEWAAKSDYCAQMAQICKEVAGIK